MTRVASSEVAQPEIPVPESAAALRSQAASDLITGTVVALLSIGYLLETGQIRILARADQGVNARSYPLLLGGVLLISSVALVITSLLRYRRAQPPIRRHQEDSDNAASRRSIFEVLRVGLKNSARLYTTCLVTAVYLLVLPYLGFLISTVPLFAVLMLIADGGAHHNRRRLLVYLAAGCLAAVLTHVLFDGLLGVFLPSGLFDPTWGL